MRGDGREGEGGEGRGTVRDGVDAVAVLVHGHVAPLAEHYLVGRVGVPPAAHLRAPQEGLPGALPNPPCCFAD